jgi:hypothetical protein
VPKGTGEDKLTQRQRDLALLVFREPSLKLGEAGLKIKGGTKQSAQVWASRTLRLPKVQAYLSRLSSQAVATMKEERAAVASMREVLEYQTRVMRSKLGAFVKEGGGVDVEAVRNASDGIVRRFKSKMRTVRVGEEFVPEVETDIEIADPQKAADALMGHYHKIGGLDKPQVNIASITVLAPEERRNVIKRFLSEPEDVVDAEVR